MINIIISEDYSKTPGGREKAEGPFSGEDFRETILREKFLLALEKKEKLFIDFDNTYGFAPSFIEEAFGGLIRELDFLDVDYEFIKREENLWKIIIL